MKINTNLIVAGLLFITGAHASQLPNIVLVMTDDQGWGQTGYNGHPLLKTPNIDAMAENGLRFNRFYASAPVCSPTRASVLTGRTNDRTGVPTHGRALRLQEKTLGAALKAKGYRTGHFGKWHLNALRGHGVPILENDTHGPKAFGFDVWLSVTNFFDIDPYMSRNGSFEDFKGDSSDVIVTESLEFMKQSARDGKPFLALVWDGSPHDPFLASEEDCKPFAHLSEKSMHHYGEMVAFDRALGKLRQGLRDLNLADNTIVWFCSDNGGLEEIKPDAVGGLRGYKGEVYEGGIRVPAIIEWPAKIKPRITNYPASTMDIFPTLADLLDLPDGVMCEPVDGSSIAPLFEQELAKRETFIPFRFRSYAAVVDNQYKLVCLNQKKGTFELYDLDADAQETRDIANEAPEVFARLKQYYEQWSASVDASVDGKDYPGGLDPNQPKSTFWAQTEKYEPYFEEFKKRNIGFRGGKKPKTKK